jgi:hypothetical protein
MIQLGVLLLNFIINVYLVETAGDCHEQLETATWHPPAVPSVHSHPNWDGRHRFRATSEERRVAVPSPS